MRDYGAYIIYPLIDLGVRFALPSAADHRGLFKWFPCANWLQSKVRQNENRGRLEHILMEFRDLVFSPLKDIKWLFQTSTYEPPSPPASPLNSSTEAPEATNVSQLTCKALSKRSRKRRLNFDDAPENSKKSKTAEKTEPSTERRRVLTPKRSTPTKPTLKRSLEIKQFEFAISFGSWQRVFHRFGHVYKQSFALLEGVDLNLYDAHGLTSLHAAILSGDTELAVLMLKNGANFNLATLRGWSPLSLAANNPKMLETYLDFVAPKKS